MTGKKAAKTSRIAQRASKMRSQGGGRRVSAGLGYQYSYGAFLAVQVIARSAPLWDLDPSVEIQSILTEQDVAVDDLVALTSNGGFAFVQAKRSVDVSPKPASPFYKALSGFTELYIGFAKVLQARNAPPRSFDVARDRLVFAVGRRTSKNIVDGFQSVCTIARSSAPIDSAANKHTANALATAATIIENAWKNHTGANATPEEVRSVLASIWVHPCECDDGERDHVAALNQLRTVVLPAAKDGPVWQRLKALCHRHSNIGGGFDRTALYAEVRQAGADVLGSQADHREDRARIVSESKRFADRYRAQTYVTIAGEPLRLRPETQRLLSSEAQRGSLLVIGQPGVGKTGSVVTLYAACQEAQVEAAFVPVERLRTGGGNLEKLFGLRKPMREVMTDWGGTQPAFFIIDGLDAARGIDELNDVVEALFQMASSASPRWKFIVSMRSYDALRARLQNTELPIIFRVTEEAPQISMRAELEGIRCFEVPELTNDDLAPARSKLNALDVALGNPDVLKLARIPFNLWLLIGLIEDGLVGSELQSITTQIQLLNSYWKQRVERGDETIDRERLLTRACQLMIQERALTCDRNDLLQSGQEERVANDLCSIGVLDELRMPGAFSAAQYRFSHNTLFDFAVAKRILAQRGELDRLLADNPGALTLIVPSLRMFFQELWDEGAGAGRRDRFWTTLLDIAANEELPAVASVIGVAIASRKAEATSEVSKLVEGLDNPRSRRAALRIIEWIHGSLGMDGVDPFAKAGEPWDYLARALMNDPGDGADWASFRLQSMLLERGGRLSEAALQNVATAARELLNHLLASPVRNDRFISVAIATVMKSAGADVAVAARALRPLLAANYRRTNAWSDMPAIARELSRLHASAPDFVAEVYDACFHTQELSEETVSISQSRIFAMTSNRRQDLDHAKWQLGRDYQSFLDASPVAATRAVVAAVDAYAKTHNVAKLGAGCEVQLGSISRHVTPDMSSSWLDTILTKHEPAFDMLEAWCKGMDQLYRQDTRLFEACFNDFIATSWSAVYWRKLLSAAARYPETLGRAVFPLLTQRPVLTGYDTSDAAADAVTAVYPLLSTEERAAIEHAILAI